MTHINQRRDTSTNWTSANPVLQLGEVGHETNTRKYKLGDGVTAWNSLPYANPAGVISVAGKTGVVTLVKADVGLGSVNNTADLDKPVSGPQQTALDTKVGATYVDDAVDALADDIANDLIVVNNGLTKKFHGVRVKQSTGQVISNNTVTALTFNTEIFDTDSFHDTVTNNSRLTVPAGMDGYYRCVAGVGYTAAWTSANFSDIYFFKSGVQTLSNFRYIAVNDYGVVQIAQPPILLAAGDYMEVKVKQQAGANRTTDSSLVTYFSMEWLGAA